VLPGCCCCCCWKHESSCTSVTPKAGFLQGAECQQSSQEQQLDYACALTVHAAPSRCHARMC
jgi:hypothetical protein